MAARASSAKRDFRSQSNVFNVFRPSVLSCLRNFPTRRFSVKRISYFIGVFVTHALSKALYATRVTRQNAIFCVFRMLN